MSPVSATMVVYLLERFELSVITASFTYARLAYASPVSVLTNSILHMHPGGPPVRPLSLSACRLIWLLAAATTASTVKPNFLSSCLSGADAPKVSMQTLCPSVPVYLLQPKSEACFDRDARLYVRRQHRIPVRLHPGRRISPRKAC